MFSTSKPAEPLWLWHSLCTFARKPRMPKASIFIALAAVGCGNCAVSRLACIAYNDATNPRLKAHRRTAGLPCFCTCDSHKHQQRNESTLRATLFVSMQYPVEDPAVPYGSKARRLTPRRAITSSSKSSSLSNSLGRRSMKGNEVETVARTVLVDLERKFPVHHVPCS